MRIVKSQPRKGMQAHPLGMVELPICFTKQDLLSTTDSGLETVNSRIRRALKRGDFLQLKNGLYVLSRAYIHELDKQKFHEYISSYLLSDSYLSLEYILENHGVLLHPQGKSTTPLTSITTKTNRTFKNFAGSFVYKNIKSACYFGFEERVFQGKTYFVATKAKALFDYLYLNSDLDCRNQKRLKFQLFHELGIQWQNFSEEDFKQFDSYVWKSNSFKMMKILRHIADYFEKKEFDRWAKKLLL